jgi:small subunit ribosomal protein S1
MSTENTPEPTLSQPTVPQNPASLSPEPQNQAPADAQIPPSGDEADLAVAPLASSEGEARRKLQLRPTPVGDMEARGIPSQGDSSGAVPSPAGPVAIPAHDDQEVEAELNRAVSQVTADAVATPPEASSEPVEIPQQESIDATLEAAIEAAMAAGTEASAGGDATPVPATDIDQLQPGQKLSGVVQSVSGDSVFVDFGLRLSGAVPFRQFDVKTPPQVGDTLELVFDRVNEAEGLILANRPRGTTQVRGDWDAIAPDQVVECVVSKTNKGGLEVLVSRLRGFIPASQVELGFVADLQGYVGQKLRVRVTEVNPAKRKLVLSRKALLAEEREAARAELLNEIKPDQVRTGRVKTIKDYGAFVDLGGMDGFLPVAQMSWVRIGHPSEVLQEGQEIEVKVLSIDREKNRISLGMRQLAPNPWRTAEEKYAKGSTVNGRVTRVEAFGAFVELEPGVEGLVHISELDHRRVNRVTEVLNVGDLAEVQVIEVDPKKKRISLSTKALKAKPEPVEKPKDEELAPGKGQAYERKRKEPLKGGTGDPKQRGGLFGNPRDFS